MSWRRAGEATTLGRLSLISTISITRRYAECRYAEFRYAECRYAKCRYAECRYAECHGATKPEQCPTLAVYYYYSLLS